VRTGIATVPDFAESLRRDGAPDRLRAIAVAGVANGGAALLSYPLSQTDSRHHTRGGHFTSELTVLPNAQAGLREHLCRILAIHALRSTEASAMLRVAN